jgi:cytochrome c oxidase subunit 2
MLLTACAEPGTTASLSAAQAAAEHGERLFRNKGCLSCHVNQRVADSSSDFGSRAPDLTSYRNDPAFLRRWLADPAAVRPGTRMPNMQLNPSEIEDLIAFLIEPR